MQETTLYSTEGAAAANFEQQMSAPYVLTRFLDRVTWSATLLPTLVHGATYRAVPVLQDITGDERMRVEAMKAELLRGKF